MPRETSVRVVDAPVERVWRVLADHEGMSSWAPGLRVKVIRSGTDDPNGAGAVRKVGMGVAGPIVEIVEVFEPEERLGYRALAGVPFKNYRGEVTLRPVDHGTEITYAVTVDRRLPVGESFAIRTMAATLLSGLVRGVRNAGS